MRALRARFEAARRRVLIRCVRRDTLRSDVLRDARCACAANFPRRVRGQFDLKQDAGGIADIEFLVQYWVLAAAHEHPQLVTFPTTSASSKVWRAPVACPRRDRAGG